MYVTRPGDSYVVPTSDFLGEMSDEMGPEDVILSFISGGAKQYGIKYRTGKGDVKTIVKARGFSRAYYAALDLNYAAMERLVGGMVRGSEDWEETRPVTLRFDQIGRDQQRRVFTKAVEKTYAPVFNKRVLFPDYSTLPFGYCR